MYIVVITEEDFIGSEKQVKYAKKQLKQHAAGTVSSVKNPYTSGALNSVCMSMSVGRVASSMA